MRSLLVKDLRIGMVLDQDVRTGKGAMVVPKGHKITQIMLARIRSYAELQSIAEPVRVLVPTPRIGGCKTRVA